MGEGVRTEWSCLVLGRGLKNEGEKARKWTGDQSESRVKAGKRLKSIDTS